MSRSSRSARSCRVSPSCARSSARYSGSGAPPVAGMSAAVSVSVPASSANLGPGFDCFAAALGLFLELDDSEAERLEVRGELEAPGDRSTLAVAAFEPIRPADGHRFEIRSEIPLSG